MQPVKSKVRIVKADNTIYWGNNMRTLIRFLLDEEGPTAVEYAVMLALILGMIVAVIASAGGVSQSFWQDSADSLDTAVN